MSFVWRRKYVCQIHDLRERKRGRWHSDLLKNDKKIDFVLIKKEH